MLGQGHWGDVIITESPRMSRKGVEMIKYIVNGVDEEEECRRERREAWERIEELESGLERLRRIEAVILDGETREVAARELRRVALELNDGVYDTWINAIADAL